MSLAGRYPLVVRRARGPRAAAVAWRVASIVAFVAIGSSAGVLFAQEATQQGVTPVQQPAGSPDISATQYSGDVAAPPIAEAVSEAPASFFAPPGGQAPQKPISWISGPYFNAGPDFVLGDGLFDSNHKVGYAISGGVRQPLGPGFARDRMFLDIGGSYLSAFGNSTRNTVGLETLNNQLTGLNTTRLVPDAFATTITEARRYNLNGSLGWFWGSPVDTPGDDPQVRFALRFGGRWGNVDGRFLDQALTLPPPPANTTHVRTDTTYSRTDTFGGLFGSAEAILLHRNTAWGDVQWTADAEFGHDWIGFDGYDSTGLGTATLLFGCMITR